MPPPAQLLSARAQAPLHLPPRAATPQRRGARAGPGSARRCVASAASNPPEERTREASGPGPGAASPKVSFVSLARRAVPLQGCAKNTVDGEILLRDLSQGGFEVTDDHDAADAIVINTCGFVEDAKGESIEAILEAAQLKQVGLAAAGTLEALDERGEKKKIVVTGCLAQRYSHELADEIPEADLVVGFEHYARGMSPPLQWPHNTDRPPQRHSEVPSELHAALGTGVQLPTPVVSVQQASDGSATVQLDGVPLAGAGPQERMQEVQRVQVRHGQTSGGLPASPQPTGLGGLEVGEPTVPFRQEGGRYRLTPKHTAYLRVAEGCDHKCTFCAIPSFRGKFRSKAWSQLLEEAQWLVKDGVKEINLIAEDTNQYGIDRKDGKGLAELLRELNDIEGLEWIRILYAYPSYFSEELIDAIAELPKVPLSFCKLREHSLTRPD
eukprot:scaffold845_cov364-Prasinococcus_capsulatus_cf.AAC.11